MSRAPWRLPAAGLLAAVTTLTGCLHYHAHVRVEENGEVTVTERVVMDREWQEQVGDSLGASEQVIRRYGKEARERGATVETFGRDSAHALFHFDSLEEFAERWPDTSDNGTRWDRSLYHRRELGDTLVEELILFRMAPPDPAKRLPNQRYPILSFTVSLPRPAIRHNADRFRGTDYFWRFTEEMTEPDSVWLAWPAEAGR